MKKVNVGGQAVIEGVMMRGPACMATAVRKTDGEIIINKKPFSTVAERWPFLKKPLLRGIVALFESLAYGMKELSWSAQAAGEEEETLSTKELALTMAFAICLAIGLFIVLPTSAAKFMASNITDHFWLNVAEGIFRLTVFLLYVSAISMMKDIQRVFQYHGAEHKTIHAYEAGLELTPENVRGFSTLHPRCGTNFLLIVMFVSIFIFAFLGWPSLVERIVSRIVLMPLVAGISYEVIRFAGNNFQKSAVKAIIMPGLMLQKLTTREPSDDQIEVAIEALKAALPDVFPPQDKAQEDNAVSLQEVANV